MTALRRFWPCCVLAALISIPVTAQPTDPSTSGMTEPEEAPAAADPGSAEEPLPIAPEARAAPTAAPHPTPLDDSSGAEKHGLLLALFGSLLGVGVLLFIAERLRAWMRTNLLVQRATGALGILLRLAGLGLLLAIVLELVPGGQSWILGTLLVLALVIGWSVRDLFADVVAGTILAAERRVKKGVWVSGDGFEGTVEARSLRATWLRDGQGHRLTVPNRQMVGAPLAYDAGADAEHEVIVRLEGYRDAGKVRLALTDAILSSPWVLAGSAPVVLRDPADPVVWRVRAKLLEPRFSFHFEGELLERVEDLLRYEPERETVPSEAPPKAD